MINYQTTFINKLQLPERQRILNSLTVISKLIKMSLSMLVLNLMQEFNFTQKTSLQDVVINSAINYFLEADYMQFC